MLEARGRHPNALQGALRVPRARQSRQGALRGALWQLAATDFNAPQQWKRQQEAAMKRTRGSGLDAAAIDDFIRMIQTAIPATSFTLNQASVVIDIDPDRRLRQIRVRP